MKPFKGTGWHSQTKAWFIKNFNVVSNYVLQWIKKTKSQNPEGANIAMLWVYHKKWGDKTKCNQNFRRWNSRATLDLLIPDGIDYNIFYKGWNKFNKSYWRKL